MSNVPETSEVRGLLTCCGSARRPGKGRCQYTYILVSHMCDDGVRHHDRNANWCQECNKGRESCGEGLGRSMPRSCCCRCKVVGHDFGGALAWGLAIAQPERVEKLCVISVGHLGESVCILLQIKQACYSWGLGCPPAIPCFYIAVPRQQTDSTSFATGPDTACSRLSKDLKPQAPVAYNLGAALRNSCNCST